MLEQPALRVRRSSQEDRVHQHLSDIVVKLKRIGQSVGYSNDHSSDVKEKDRVHQHLSDFIIALKLFAKSLGYSNDHSSNVKKEDRVHQHLSDIAAELKHIGQSVGYSNDHFSDVKEEDRDEEWAGKVNEELRAFYIALKKLGGTREEFRSDPFSDVEAEARKHWSQRTMNETNLKMIARMLREHLPQLNNTDCMGKDERFQIEKWCPDFLRKLSDVTHSLYHLHRAVTRNDYMAHWYFVGLEPSTFETSIKDSSRRERIVKRIDVFLYEMQK
ncbi:unnamed protein product [Nippostrongylus brasiliensis]|uniref:KEN domain-containing protein n=1 Tax=Nippostrongylus brasiliensis TaxID=27835 RepID=A0A0N4YHX1_NIPBR|nr:unnamed protein product [Nippostrongylus brasiliensis]